MEMKMELDDSGFIYDGSVPVKDIVKLQADMVEALTKTLAAKYKAMAQDQANERWLKNAVAKAKKAKPS